jgi:acyl carrier protein
MQATPATWRLLVDAGWNGGKPLRILCGGEALPQELAEQLLDRGSALWNLYGPTETTIWSAALRVESGDGPVPIGRPIDNTQLYLLDAHLRPVPIGVPGELCIGGVGLARGYLNRPELTAERFMPHPFSEEPGARLYKTGDLARYRPDGLLEFLGRLDHQVKVRGYRIELGEIEAVLTQHPAVRESVVLAREDTPGDRRVVAYVVADQPPWPSSRELRGFLQAQLPHYMVPAAVVLLESLPLTPNGKVDRRALPAPDQESPGKEETFVPPRTATEKTLAEIWATVLGLERVGVYDNFFALGGHSLQAMQIISRVRTVFPVELNVYTLFAMPTVAGCAEIVEKAATGAPQKTPALSSISRETYRQQVAPRALPGPKETKKEV